MSEKVETTAPGSRSDRHGSSQPVESAAERSDKRAPSAVFIIVGVVIIGVAVAMVFGGLSKLIVGVLAIVLLLLLMAIGMPIGVAMILASVAGLIGVVPMRAVLGSLQSTTFSAVASWSLSALPLFILMGTAMWRGGIASKAYTAANQWLGRVPGGLAVATNVAGASLAASTGSSMGVTFTMGRMALPEMFRLGYSTRLSTGSVAMAGTLGQVFPPNITLIIYAGVAGTAVGPQLLAAFVPAGVLTVAFALTAIVWALVSPKEAPRANKTDVTWGSRFRALVGLIPIVVILLVVLGGMFGGIFTATEAAAFGAAAAIVISIVTAGKGNRGLRPTIAYLRKTLVSTVASVAGIFVILIGAMLLTRMMALSGLAQAFSRWLVGLQMGAVELLLVLIVFYIILGMFLETLPMVLLTVPLLSAPLQAAGVDMIWFGVFLVILCEIGMVFPPIGLLTFLVHRIAQDPEVNRGRPVPLSAVFGGTMPFVAVVVLILVLLIFVPDIALWLPESARR